MADMGQGKVDTVVFDLGGVMIDWNPRHLYRKLFDGDDAAMERFLGEICTGAWNHQFDAGRDLNEGITELCARHPDQAERIRAWQERWEEMLGGEIAGTVEVLETLHDAGVPLFAITNWSHQTFPIARRRFQFLSRFACIVVSGEEGSAKPERQLFDLLIERTGIDPARAVFIDDAPANVATARQVGFRALGFVDPGRLRADLRAMGLPV